MQLDGGLPRLLGSIDESLVGFKETALGDEHLWIGCCHRAIPVEIQLVRLLRTRHDLVAVDLGCPQRREVRVEHISEPTAKREFQTTNLSLRARQIRRAGGNRTLISVEERNREADIKCAFPTDGLAVGFEQLAVVTRPAPKHEIGHRLALGAREAACARSTARARP